MALISTRAVLVGTVPMVLVTLHGDAAGCLDCNPPPSPVLLDVSDRVVSFDGRDDWRVVGVELDGRPASHVVAVGGWWAAVAETWAQGAIVCPLCGDRKSIRYHEGRVVLRLTRGPRRQETTRALVTHAGLERP